ncbi:MAG: STAS domain-containing protein [Epsilonproteobacteria bacterium]|nr:STAS domain-containing protein [Campylobacterota bacterium]
MKKIKIDVEKFDVSNMKDIKRSIERDISRRDMRVLLDFSSVKFIDSSGLSVIITIFKRLRAVGGLLVLCGLNSQPLSLLKTTQLHRIIKIADRCYS